VRANWALEPISIHLSYSSRISSFWAVVKCPRLEERDGTSKDITDFSPRQYCQITVTRQPDTEGAHSGFGAAPVGRASAAAAGAAAASLPPQTGLLGVVLPRRDHHRLGAAVAAAGGFSRRGPAPLPSGAEALT